MDGVNDLAAMIDRTLLVMSAFGVALAPARLAWGGLEYLLGDHEAIQRALRQVVIALMVLVAPKLISAPVLAIMRYIVGGSR